MSDQTKINKNKQTCKILFDLNTVIDLSFVTNIPFKVDSVFCKMIKTEIWVISFRFSLQLKAPTS